MTNRPFLTVLFLALYLSTNCLYAGQWSITEPAPNQTYQNNSDIGVEGTAPSANAQFLLRVIGPGGVILQSKDSVSSPEENIYETLACPNGGWCESFNCDAILQVRQDGDSKVSRQIVLNPGGGA